MALNIAVTILLSPCLAEYKDFASKLLNYFVETFGQMYGVHMISHNNYMDFYTLLMIIIILYH